MNSIPKKDWAVSKISCPTDWKNKKFDSFLNTQTRTTQHSTQWGCRWSIHHFLLLLLSGEGLQEVGYPFTQLHNQSAWVHSPDLWRKKNEGGVSNPASRQEAAGLLFVSGLSQTAGWCGEVRTINSQACKQFEEGSPDKTFFICCVAKKTLP